MRYSFLILLMAAIAASASAQTPTTQGASPATAATPAASAAAPSAQTPSTPAATTGTAAKPASGAAAQTKPPAPPPIDFDKLYPDAPVKPADIHCGKSKSCVIKLPPGVPPTDATLVPDFSLYYQDIKIGTGAEAMQDNSYKLHYNAYTAADGVMFDSTYNHRRPVLDKDGKPVKDADGKPKMGDPQPFKFTEGEGRVIPGLDLGILGMKVGGKRRIVIPYQMAYGEQGRRGPNAAHPGVPPKADLIFDVDLLEVIDENAPPKPHPAATETKPATPGTPAAPAATAKAPAAATPAAPAATANPAQPQAK